MNQQNWQNTAQIILDQLKLKNIQAIIEFYWQDNIQVRFAENAINQATFKNDLNVEVTLQKEFKKLTATRNQLNEKEIPSWIDQLSDTLQFLPDDTEVVPLLPPQKYPDILPVAYEINTEEDLQKMTNDISWVVQTARSANLTSSGYYRTHFSKYFFISSTGNTGAYNFSDCSFTFTIQNEIASASEKLIAAHPSFIEVKTAAQQALETALGCMQPQEIEPKPMTVILEPTALKELIDGLSGQLFAKNCDKGVTYLSEKKGQLVFSPLVNIASKAKKNILTAPFNHEYIPHRDIQWIEKGVLKGYLYNRHWAKKTNKQPTPFSNFVMEGTDHSLNDLIAGVSYGVLIKSVWYIRSLSIKHWSLTGTTRNGVFLIKDGKICGAVKNMRFNQSIPEILNNIKQLGQTKQVSSTYEIPYAVIDNFNFTSKTTSV